MVAHEQRHIQNVTLFKMVILLFRFISQLTNDKSYYTRREVLRGVCPLSRDLIVGFIPDYRPIDFDIIVLQPFFSKGPY